MKTTSKLNLLTLIASLALVSTAHGMTLFEDKKPAATLDTKSKIIVTRQLRLLEIDAEKHNTNLLNSGDTVVHVSPGYHEFTVRYDKLWDIDYDNFDKLRSAPITVSISTQGGKSYRITHRVIESYKEAKTFSAKPEIFVVDADSGKKISTEAEGLFVPGLKNTPARKPSSTNVSTAKPITSKTTATSNASLNNKEVTSISTTEIQPGKESSLLQNTGNPASTPTPAVLPMLQYWWGKASVGEKQQFNDWIQNSPMQP
ncbi:MAG: DUF2057 family protein [Pseudomonadota bacterium]|nr:DUF2057 family protein [Pseudomonadota bacterium]